jgi:putative zinc finger protein
MVVNCEHVWREISNYLDDELDAATRAAMEAHFKECKHCTAVLDGTRNIVELYGDDRVFELPAGFSGRLQRRLAQSAVSGFGSARTFWMLAVAATALMVGGFSLANSAVFRHPEVRSKLAQPAHNIPPALMVAVSTEGRLFHVPGCRYLHKHEGESPELMTAANAMKKGYAPCSRCLRQYLSARVECPHVVPSPQLARNAGKPRVPVPGL